jgi:hypothetical protein
MKKITLLLLFCFCAVGFSQTQLDLKSSNPTVSNDSKGVSGLERAYDYLVTNVKVTTHLINQNATTVELVDGASAVSGQVTITTGSYNGTSFWLMKVVLILT